MRHPRDSGEAGYHEIQHPHGEYRIIDRAALSRLLGVPKERLADVHAEWIETALASGQRLREPQWSKAIAVGRRAFGEDLQRQLGVRARYRQIAEADGVSVLRDAEAVYDAISRSKWAA